MSVLPVASFAPCGGEGPHDALPLAEAELVLPARVAAINDLAEATVRSGRIVSF